MTDLAIKHLEDGMIKLGEEIKEVKQDVKSILSKFDELPEKYITRREYEASKEAWKGTSWLWQMVILTCVAVAWLLINIFKL